MKEPATQTKTAAPSPQQNGLAAAAKVSNLASVHPILQLQRAVGNQAVQHFIQAQGDRSIKIPILFQIPG